MPAPLRTQRPLSRTQPVGPVAVKKLPKKHSFQGSRSQPVKKAEGPMPSGNPVGQLAPPDPTAGLQVSEPQNPLDVIGSGPAKSPLGAIPDMKTLMQPAPQQFQSRNPAMSNIAATNYANKNMLQGSMPSGPRAAIPGGYPPGPSASPGAAPAPAAGPPAVGPPAAILAQPQPGLKQGSAAFEFGKRAYYGSQVASGVTGPYSGDQAAAVRAYDRLNASARYNEEMNPVNAWTNPAIHGPLSRTFNEQLSQPALASAGSSYTSAVAAPAAANFIGGAMDAVAPGAGAGASMLGLGAQAIHGNITDAPTKARDAFNADLLPHREAPDPALAAGRRGRKGGPWDASTAAGVVAADDMIASAIRNRKENTGHYLLNPFVQGPLAEVFQRYRRRVNAGMYDSWAGTLGAIPTLGVLPAIMGGPKKQDAARKDYAKRVAPYEEDQKGQTLPKPKPKAESEPKADAKPKTKKTEKAEPAEKQSAAFNFGTDIARTMKPKQVTRTTGEYRGADMKTNLHKAGC